jgi:hypothetical protein
MVDQLLEIPSGVEVGEKTMIGLAEICATGGVSTDASTELFRIILYSYVTPGHRLDAYRRDTGKPIALDELEGQEYEIVVSRVALKRCLEVWSKRFPILREALETYSLAS